MKKRTPPTKAQLEDMLKDHLSFEINRFKLGVAMWDETSHRNSLGAMVRESCLLHMRLLLDFFYPRKDPEKWSPYGDIFESDYPPNLKRQAPIWIADYRDNLDRLLAHLTIKRCNHIGFDFPPRFGELTAVIDDFLAALPPDWRALYNAERGANGDPKEEWGYYDEQRWRAE